MCTAAFTRVVTVFVRPGSSCRMASVTLCVVDAGCAAAQVRYSYGISVSAHLPGRANISAVEYQDVAKWRYLAAH